MCAYVVRAYIHTYTDSMSTAYVRTYEHAHVHACMHACTHAYRCMCVCMHIYKHIHLLRPSSVCRSALLAVPQSARPSSHSLHGPSRASSGLLVSHSWRPPPVLPSHPWQPPPVMPGMCIRICLQPCLSMPSWVCAYVCACVRECRSEPCVRSHAYSQISPQCTHKSQNFFKSNSKEADTNKTQQKQAQINAFNRRGMSLHLLCLLCHNVFC